MHDQRDELEEAHTIELLDRYLLSNGQHDILPDETGTSASSPFRRSRLESLRALWRTPRHDAVSVDDRLAQLHRRLELGAVSQPLDQAAGQTNKAQQPVRSNGRSQSPWQKAVLGYAVAGAVVVWALISGVPSIPEQLARAKGPVIGTASSYTTANGQRATVTLVDGTRVMLNVGSRLEVPADYGMTTRALRLDGEAVFSVTHSEGIPLTVAAGPSVTRVLGTKFLVKAYGADSPATVVVRDGKVAVGSRVLTAMQQISVTSTGESGIQPADTTQFAFANGVLHIRDMPLHEAIPVLNRWYDIDIRFNDPSLANRRVTIELTAGTFSDLIELFEYSFNMRVARSGRVLTLHPKA